MIHSFKNGIASRRYFQSGSIKLSYLDFGGVSENILLMLHGHFGNARTFSEIASRFKNWRVISLDQRGHGWSDHPLDKDYSRESYITDILNLICQELGGAPVTILGHSLGGVNAYQFAARHPELVKAVIVEDVGAVIHGDLSLVEKFPNRSSSLRELGKKLKEIGIKHFDYFLESVFEDEKGWGFRFDVQGMKVSQQKINGDWWGDWLSSTCPILLIHGLQSFVLDLNQAKLMESQRPNTKLEVFADCGHDVHLCDLDGFYKVMKNFLDELN
ncbi:alpha/beta fold hydrolase [Hazenella coriacea]|uniref:Pimeloyl-ACP methyl ester carboxylesterase n=1 Tax=Hazenella coriacea TaxID=1179467 RepID=A0A4R3L115_9BACL|nr:alpha/beta hydrolase [Hazenella coriacea]TCS93221.1 pimeloyl-ACP methyl ester carboxylesterase [Hazenella coriacea]